MIQTAAVHLFLGLLWGQLGLALAPSWRDGTYYSYGWLVLAACLFFYHQRRGEVVPRPMLRSRPATVALFLILGVLLLGAIALRLFQGANPFWRLVLWSHAALTVAATVGLLAFRDGTRATRHYLPALVLIFAAVPLPSTVEVNLVQNLTRSVVAVSVDLARSSGIPLEVADTAFIIRGHPLDVNDRCSGIRSFQSSVAVALIVGELFRLALPGRFLLLLLGACASFAGNTFRVLSLIQAFFHRGYEGLEARHDSAGMISVSLTYGFILATGYLLDRLRPRSAPRPAPPPGSPAGPFPPEPGWALVLGVFGALLLLGEAGRVWWLRPNEARWAATAVPVLDIPALEREAGLAPLSVSENVDTGPLRFDGAAYLRGQHERGDTLAVIAFAYRPANQNLWTDLFTHPPEVCMRSSGCALEQVFPARSLAIGSQAIPVRILKYRDPSNGSPLFVLKTIWLPPESPIQPGTTMADLRSLWVSMALHRIPHPPGAVLLTGVWGVEQESIAWDIFQRQVGRYFQLPGPS